jgi:hypothetical protein
MGRRLSKTTPKRKERHRSPPSKVIFCDLHGRQGKRGGGLEEYAKLIGKSRSNVSKFRSAAEVYSELRSTLNEVENFIDKPLHLSELHAAPPETWPLLAEAMLGGDWSVKAEGRGFHPAPLPCRLLLFSSGLWLWSLFRFKPYGYHQAAQLQAKVETKTHTETETSQP